MFYATFKALSYHVLLLSFRFVLFMPSEDDKRSRTPEDRLQLRAK
jgi:hypothetical protein